VTTVGLRAEDLRECAIMHRATPLQLLLSSIESNPDNTFAVRIGPVCVGMFGHTAHGEDGMVWMVGADALTSNRRRFMRAVKEWWPRVTQQYRMVFNFVSEENTLHRKWLTHMGCQFSPPIVSSGRDPGLMRYFSYVSPTRSRPVRA
jgi:hypothetical protein